MQQALIYIAILLSVLLPAAAQAQLFLEEGKVVLSVTGGERVAKTLTVANTGKDTIRVKIYWEDFQYQPPYDGTKKFLPSGVAAASASRWINFSPQEVVLPAFGKEKIDYTLNVPEQFDRGYYGVLFFEQINVDSVKDSTGVDLVTRVGTLFFIEPADIPKEASFDKIALKEGKITGEFINKSAVTLLPRMVYYIMEEGGMVKDRGELKSLYVPSGAAAAWELTLPDTLSAGRYFVVINADLGEENVVTKEVGLTKTSSGQLSLEIPQS